MPVITTNTSANSALRYLNNNSASQTKSLNQVASGSRINRASDDAAGLAVATKLQSEVAVLAQTSTNASHAIAVLQTADGGLSSASDVLERMKVLAAESASGAVSDSERAYIQSEFDVLNTELALISTTTTFNGVHLIDGSVTGTPISFLVGTTDLDVIDINLDDYSLAGVIAAVAGVTLGTNGDALTGLASINDAIGLLSTARASVGASQSQFNYHATQIAVSKENLDAAQSAIMDTDIAEAQADFSSAQVLTNAAISALAQANQMPQQLLKLLQ